ncbi:hypothetical protein LCGC14_0365420 [marine sediment metagenome]|uniref:Uncharacterized protein n=1 Tax=marine sediment metagenome TaxID=412755 RepID=A0A0F9VTW4_9ZZZZ
MSGYTDWLASLIGTTSSTFTAHKTRHQNGGDDEISLSGLDGEPNDTVNKSLFDANTFVYAYADNTPLAISPAEVMAILSGDAAAAFDWNGQDLIDTGKIRAATSVWWHEHDLFATSLSKGASGATQVAPNANTIGGWNLIAVGDTLYYGAHIELDWDGATDIQARVWFEVNVDNTGGADADTVDLQLVVRYKGEGETAIKSQTLEIATTVGKSAQYKQFQTVFTVDYDAGGNVVEALDIMAFALNLETDTSEVDDIIINLVELRYQMKHPNLEV